MFYRGERVEEAISTAAAPDDGTAAALLAGVG
jgi:hypothetical protein